MTKAVPASPTRAAPRLHALTGPAPARGRAGGHQARSARPQCHGRGQHRGEAPELGVRIHCLALGGVDLASSTGKLTMNILNAVAEFERDLLVERTQAGLSRAKSEGKTLGRPLSLTEDQRRAVERRLAEG